MGRSKFILFYFILSFYCISNYNSYRFQFSCEYVAVYILDPKLRVKSTVLHNPTKTSESIYSEEVGLLINHLPNNQLKDISIPFVIDSSYYILSNLIVEEDSWYIKDYVYSQNIWL